MSVTLSDLHAKMAMPDSQRGKFQTRKTTVPQYWSDIGFKGIVASQVLPSLHGEPLEIILTVPLSL